MLNNDNISDDAFNISLEGILIAQLENRPS